MFLQKNLVILFYIFFLFCFQCKVFSQERIPSTFDFEEQKLQILVYVIGETGQQGWHRIPDNTNLVQLISLVGETEFSQLLDVTITRHELADSADAANGSFDQSAKQITIRYNVKKYLKNEAKYPPPLLKPGDIIYIRRNKWWKWSKISAILRDMAFVVTTYFIIRNSTR
jgi:hypothetical protein